MSNLYSSKQKVPVVWWLLAAIVFIAPIPLGSNRPWSWALLTIFELLAVATFIFSQPGNFFPTSPKRKRLFWLLLIFASIPLLQLMPIPAYLLSYFSSGSVQGWGELDAVQYLSISLDRGSTLEIGIRQGITVLFAMMAMRLFSRTSLRWHFVLLIVAVGSVNGAIGLIEYMAEDAAALFNRAFSTSRDAVSGTYVNKNHFAGLLAMTFPFAMGLLMHAWQKEGRSFIRAMSSATFIVALVMTLIQGAAIILSNSRGGVIALATGFFIAWLLHAKTWVSALRGLVLAIAVATASAGLFLMEKGDAGLEKYSTHIHDWERIVLWQDTLEASGKFWLLGSGVGTYNYVYPQFKSAELGYPRFDHAHNDYLEILLTMGGVGLAIFLLLIRQAFICYRSVSGSVSDRRGVLRFVTLWSIVTAMMHALVDFNWQIPANFMLFMLILVFMSTLGRSAQIEKM